MNPIWNENCEIVTFDKLKGKAKTKVLIIGGGIAGILCAYMLKEAGVDYMLVEKDRICRGVTQNTNAKITLAHGLIYDKIIKKYGIEMARLYLNAQAEAMKKFEELGRKYQCDYEVKDSYVYSTNDVARIEKERIVLEKIGYKSQFFDKLSIPLEVAGALRVENQAQINPLKLLYALARDLNIYESTKVIELAPNKAILENGEVECEKIIVATHFPIINKHGAYFLKMYQHRSYTIALENAQELDGMYVDESQNGMSFRSYKGVLFLSGGDHRTGKKGGCWQELEHFATKNYPKAKIIGKWATQDCMTLDSIPYIGKYSRGVSDLYVSTGFNKWGMTNSMVSAMILTDLVQGKENKYARVFSPSRKILHPQLFINAYESLIGLITPTTPRCPHLGCALKYNKEEHSWDCACHGSRFDEQGRVLNNPATADKRSISQKRP